MNLRNLASATRAQSTLFSIFGIVGTAILASLPIIFGSQEFHDALYQLLAKYPTIAALILLLVNTIVTELLKAAHNNAVITTVERRNYLSDSVSASKEESRVVLF
jgi:hypothetical protein